jgi:hypothetical protein
MPEVSFAVNGSETPGYLAEPATQKAPGSSSYRSGGVSTATSGRSATGSPVYALAPDLYGGVDRRLSPTRRISG